MLNSDNDTTTGWSKERGDELRIWRKGNALTQEQAGTLCGVGATTVGRWERGARPPKGIPRIIITGLLDGFTPKQRHRVVTDYYMLRAVSCATREEAACRFGVTLSEYASWEDAVVRVDTPRKSHPTRIHIAMMASDVEANRHVVREALRNTPVRLQAITVAQGCGLEWIATELGIPVVQVGQWMDGIIRSTPTPDLMERTLSLLTRLYRIEAAGNPQQQLAIDQHDEEQRAIHERVERERMKEEQAAQEEQRAKVEHIRLPGTPIITPRRTLPPEYTPTPLPPLPATMTLNEARQAVEVANEEHRVRTRAEALRRRALIAYDLDPAIDAAFALIIRRLDPARHADALDLLTLARAEYETK